MPVMVATIRSAATDERNALLAYNHSGAYAEEVLAIAARYRTLAAQTSVPVATDPVGWALQWLGTAYVYGGNHGANPLDPASLPLVPERNVAVALAAGIAAGAIAGYAATRLRALIARKLDPAMA